jgi:bacterioferritin-associated ferredoxin
MIVCHCTGIRKDDIHTAIDWMRASDPETIITPGKVYRALGKKVDCGGCLPLFIQTMSTCPNLQVPAELTGLKTRKAKSERNPK